MLVVLHVWSPGTVVIVVKLCDGLLAEILKLEVAAASELLRVVTIYYLSVKYL